MSSPFQSLFKNNKNPKITAIASYLFVDVPNFNNFSGISDMWEKALDLPDIKDILVGTMSKLSKKPDPFNGNCWRMNNDMVILFNLYGGSVPCRIPDSHLFAFLIQD